MPVLESMRAYSKEEVKGASHFSCGPCPKCGKKGIPRGRGSDAYCVCPVCGKYPATLTNKKGERK